MSSGQLVSCMQLPASLDPMLTMAHPQQQHHQTMWLHQQDQPSMVLSQGCVIQQVVDTTSLWGMPQQQQPGRTDAAPMQAAPSQSSTCSMDVGKLSAVLQDILVTLQPPASQAVSTGISSSAPLVLQLAGPPSSQAGMSQQMPVINMAAGNVHQQQQQPMQQVFTNSAGEQVLLVGGASAQAATQQSIPVSTSSTGEVQVLLQQLQEALHHVPCDTAAAAVQQVLMCVQPSQPQTLQQPATTLLLPEGAVMTSSYSVMTQPTSFPPHVPANSCGTGSPVSGATSHWQSSSDNLCNGSGANSSSTYIVHSGPPAPPGSTGMMVGQGGVLHIVSGPQMPQPHLNTAQGAGFAHNGMAGGGAGSNSTGQHVHRLGGMPAGPGMHVAMPPGCMHQQHQDSHYILPDHAAAGQQAYQQAGRQQLQHGRHQPFRGKNSAPYVQQNGRMAPPPKQQATQAAGFGGPAQGPAGGPGGAAAPSRACMDECASQHDSSTPTGAAGAGGPSASTGPGFSGPAAHVSLDEGLKQLWTGEQLQSAKGGRLFNIEQRMAWQAVGEPDPGAQDLYDFQKLKHVMQKLDAVHRTRVKLIKRLHAVADYGGCDMKSVYFETRCMIGEMMHNAAAQGRPLEECRITGLVRLAVVLQEALEQGPKEEEAARAAEPTTPAAAVAAAAAGSDATPAGVV